MYKLKVLCISFIFCLAFSISAQSWVGKWKMEFTTDEGILVLTADLKTNGTYTLDLGADGTIEVNGTYTMSDDTMTFSDNGACQGIGVYKVKATDTTLTLTKISDECTDRTGPDGIMVGKRM